MHSFDTIIKKTPPRILMVDDNIMFCNMIECMLAEYGLETDTFTTPEVAIHEFASGIYTAAMLDIYMPDMNGVELYKVLHPIDPRMPVFGITGYADDELAVSAIDAGFKTIWSKTTKIDEIILQLIHSIKVKTRRLLLQRRRYGDQSGQAGRPRLLPFRKREYKVAKLHREHAEMYADKIKQQISATTSDIKYISGVSSFTIKTDDGELLVCVYSQRGSYGGTIHEEGEVFLGTAFGIRELVRTSIRDPNMVNSILTEVEKYKQSHALERDTQWQK